MAFSSGTSSSRETGYNCFTWAREQLDNLDVEHITIPNSVEMRLAAMTSRYLVDPRHRATMWYQRPMAVAAMVAGAAAVTGVAVANSDSLSNTCKMM